MKIEGIPEGWELGRIGYPKKGDFVIGNDGCVREWDMLKPISVNYVIVKQIEPPKPSYRPFANAAEFAPHRDRWVKNKTVANLVGRCVQYDDNKPMFTNGEVEYGRDYAKCFECLCFEDGTPFGIEVKQ